MEPKPTYKTTPRVTKKLRQASSVLGMEWLADDPDFVLTLFKQGKVTHDQVYKAVEHFGWRWRDGRWRLVWPRWLEKAVAKRDAGIILSWSKEK